MDAQDRYPVARASVAPADAAWLALGISLVSGFWPANRGSLRSSQEPSRSRTFRRS